MPKNSIVFSVLGPYREDSFYFAPAGAMISEGDLLVDFAVRRKGFQLYKLPGNAPDFLQTDRRIMPPSDTKPKPLKAILERKYAGFKLPDGLR